MATQSESQTVRPSFTANLAAVLGGQAASVMIAILSEICYARFLGPGPRGQISLCMMAIAVGVLVGSLGGEIPIVIWTADRSRKVTEWLSTVLLWALLGCGVAGVLWWAAYSRWETSWLRGVTPSLSKLVLLSIPCTILFQYVMALLTGQERFRARATLILVESAGGLSAFLVIAALFGWDASAAVLGNLTGIMIAAIVGALLLKNVVWSGWAAPAADRKMVDGLLMGLRGQAGNVASFLNYRLDVFIVNYFLNPVQVGLYALGVAVSEALWQIPQAAALALFPRTARTIGEAGAIEFSCLIMRQVFLISCVSGLAVAAFSPMVIPLVFGARFSPSVPVIWWILPGAVATSLAKVAASVLGGRHKTGYASVSSFVSLAVTIVLDVVLIPVMGIRGAALASSGAYLVNAALLLWAVHRELRVKWSALFVPSRLELKQYKQAWFRFAAWSGFTSAT